MTIGKEDMLGRFRSAPLYLAIIVACHLFAWAVASVVVNGDLGYSVEYFQYFWSGSGGERPIFTGIVSIVVTILLSWFFIWLLRRSRQKKEPIQLPETTRGK